MKKIILLISLITLISCNKTYTYIEVVSEKSVLGNDLREEEPIKIKAKNDTLAYIKAYKNFLISRKALRMTSKILEEKGLSKEYSKTLVSFKLFNPDGIDISEISFNTKDATKKHIAALFENDLTDLSSDLNIVEEQSKVIGDIKFGMKKDEVSTLISKFDNKMQRDHLVLGKPFKSYFIGNFEYFIISDFYYKDELYRIDVKGAVVSYKDYESDMPISIKNAQDVIQQKFGSPDYDRSIPATFQMEEGYVYTIKEWNVGTKRIRINIEDNGDYYMPVLVIYMPSIEEKIKEEKRLKEDSILKSAESIF